MENFSRRHGRTTVTADGEALRGVAEDGSTFLARLPFGRAYAGRPTDAGMDEVAAELAAAAAGAVPADWGLLLVRKGGFAVARLSGTELVEHKVGQRHVQGRSKAGGWSQQRFARRRANQAREAYEAAADHAARILDGLAGPVVTGGDHAAVQDVLADPRLVRLRVCEPWLPVPDPRRDVLDAAVADATGIRITVVNSGA
jgi:hypothetical protein